MNIVCLDMEGVLVPEIWITFAEVSGIPELKRTTRDEPNYDKLMEYRLNILREHGLGLKEIQETIGKIDPQEARDSERRPERKGHVVTRAEAVQVPVELADIGVPGADHRIELVRIRRRYERGVV